MYCMRCGTQNDDNSYRCVQCGEILHPDDTPLKIPSYLAQSILVTLFCCMPLGIPAIVFAAQVGSKVQGGDIAGAEASSRRAKLWCWWAFGVGIVFQTFSIIMNLIPFLQTKGYFPFN